MPCIYQGGNTLPCIYQGGNTLLLDRQESHFSLDRQESHFSLDRQKDIKSFLDRQKDIKSPPRPARKDIPHLDRPGRTFLT